MARGAADLGARGAAVRGAAAFEARGAAERGADVRGARVLGVALRVVGFAEDARGFLLGSFGIVVLCDLFHRGEIDVDAEFVGHRSRVFVWQECRFAFR